MSWEIVCVMQTGKPIMESIGEELFQTAQAMLASGKRRQQLRILNAEGMITTDFREAILGAFAGVLFTAEVDTIAGSAKITYLVTALSEEQQKMPRQWTRNPNHTLSPSQASWN